MTRLTHIDHIQLAMPEGKEDQARAFYGVGLGLTEVPKPDALKKRAAHGLKVGRCRYI